MQDERRPTQKTQKTANKHPSETEPQSGSSWLSTIRERLSGLEAIIAFITTLIAFAVALQENFYLSILILVIGGLVVLLVLLMHLAFGGMPRLGGDKGEQGQQNAIVRPWALVGLLMVLGLAVSPLFWRPSRSFVASAMRGTPTPTPSATPTPTRTSTPTVTPTAIPTATPTPRPEVLRMTLESVDLQMEVACTKPVLIPADVEPSEVEYRQMADWVTYGMFQDRSFAELTLTNLSDTEWIKVSNQVMARVISHTELPGPIDFARLVGCGGIGAAREFPPIEIDAERLTSASVPDVDFFTLQKGEFEVFRVELNATEPGLYEVALGVEYSYEGTTREAWTQQPVKVYAPESYYIWTNAGGGLQMQDLYDR